MANRQKRESELSEGIKGISKFAGTLVGTMVVTSKRIVGSAASLSQGPKDNSRKKSIRVSTRNKSTVKPKAVAAKKKKAVKRKKGGVSAKKKTSKSPAKKKASASKKKTTSKTKKGPVPEKVAGIIPPISQREP